MSDEPIVRISGQPPKAGAESPKQKPKGLGRGLGALMGETRREEPLARRAGPGSGGQVGQATDGLAMLVISDIQPHADQPRRHFDDSALDELAASISQRGVIQPIIVRPKGKGRYQLVAGERRWRAAQRARLHEIPAIVRELDEREVMALALIENLQREDLNPIEEARAFQRLSDDEGITQAEIAKMVNKSRSHVANFQRLLTLPSKVIELVENGNLSMGHARALIGEENAEKIAKAAVSGGLSVRAVEKLVRDKSRNETRRASTKSGGGSEGNADITAVQSHLEEILGLPVRIAADKDPRSGAVTIRYATLDQLDLICQRLTGGAI